MLSAGMTARWRAYAGAVIDADRLWQSGAVSDPMEELERTLAMASPWLRTAADGITAEFAGPQISGGGAGLDGAGAGLLRAVPPAASPSSSSSVSPAGAGGVSAEGGDTATGSSRWGTPAGSLEGLPMYVSDPTSSGDSILLLAAPYGVPSDMLDPQIAIAYGEGCFDSWLEVCGSGRAAVEICVGHNRTGTLAGLGSTRIPAGQPMGAQVWARPDIDPPGVYAQVWLAPGTRAADDLAAVYPHGYIRRASVGSNPQTVAPLFRPGLRPVLVLVRAAMIEISLVSEAAYEMCWAVWCLAGGSAGSLDRMTLPAPAADTAPAVSASPAEMPVRYCGHCGQTVPSPAADPAVAAAPTVALPDGDTTTAQPAGDTTAGTGGRKASIWDALAAAHAARPSAQPAPAAKPEPEPAPAPAAA